MASTAAAYLVALEDFYRIAMMVISAIDVPLFVLTMLLVWRYTPKEMGSFRYTVTNCTVWMSLSVHFFTFFFRPVVLSPLSIAAVTGFFPSRYALYVGMTLWMNVSVSFTLCLGTQYATVAFPMLSRRLAFRHGIATFVSCHATMTLLCVAVAAYSATTDGPSDTLRHAVQHEFPQLSGYLKDHTLIGFLPDSGPALITPCAVVWFTLLAAMWIFMLVSTIRTVVFKANKTNDERASRSRRTVGLMLATRTLIPLFTMAMPAVMASLLILLRVEEVSGGIAGCMILAAMTGFLKTIPVTLYMKPYQEALMKIFRLGSIKRILGFSDGERVTNATTKGVSVVSNGTSLRHVLRRSSVHSSSIAYITKH